MTLTTDATHSLRGKRVAFVGKLGAMPRKEAMQMVRDQGGYPLDRAMGDVDLVVIGADQLPAEDVSELLSESIRRGMREGRTSLVHEHELWQQLGVVEESSNMQLYTPAMMAGLIKTPVRNIRRWFRMGLLRCTKIAHRLPYFDFEQVQNAKQLASWIARGARPTDIKRQLNEFGPWVENRSLIDLDLVIDGRRLLLRHGGHLLSATGQLHLDFELSDGDWDDDDHAMAPCAATLPMEGVSRKPTDQELTREELVQTAEELEDAGQLEHAIGWYRIVLAKYGLSADICFQLAELLYRSGDSSAARERYYNAIELDEDFIEARANLGCVLAETGQTDLAIAAFQGALLRDDRYPDVHYHLAKCLDEIGDAECSARHWIRFLQLAPQSPWAEEALERLGRV
ncbi:MAG: MerR family transcriptional regulator [Pirellula sp.]